MNETVKRIFFILVLYSFLAGCEDAGEISKSNLSIQSVSGGEGDEGESILEAEVKLDKPAEADITVFFFTSDSTAISGKDYRGIAEGNITIAKGANSGKIPLIILGDKHMEFTEIFLLHIRETENANIVNEKVPVKIIDNDSYIIEKDNDGYITPDEYEDFTLVWSDEFNANEIEQQNWTHEMGNNNGWGNQELEDYTDKSENSRIENGKLVITALENTPGNYTSARMITKDKQEFKYGRIDIRAKLPQGQGIWPAIWMLGANFDDVGWPKCGEVDIMELVGHIPNEVHGTVHYDNGSGWEMNGTGTRIPEPSTFADEFHVFSILWERDQIKWYVDYKKFHEITQGMIGPTYPFNKSFFFILNVAVGGIWPGYPDETTVFPQQMTIDYVRVFQQAAAD